MTFVEDTKMSTSIVHRAPSRLMPGEWHLRQTKSAVKAHADVHFLYMVLFGLIGTMSACGSIAAYLAWSGG